MQMQRSVHEILGVLPVHLQRPILFLWQKQFGLCVVVSVRIIGIIAMHLFMYISK